MDFAPVFRKGCRANDQNKGQQAEHENSVDQLAQPAVNPLTQEALADSGNFQNADFTHIITVGDDDGWSRANGPGRSASMENSVYRGTVSHHFAAGLCNHDQLPLNGLVISMGRHFIIIRSPHRVPIKRRSV